MAEMIGFDYTFEEFSLLYGQFVVDAKDGYPEGKIERVTHHYPYVEDRIVVHFAAPEEITVLLKLRFGAHIVTRPPKKEPDLVEDLSALKSYITQIGIDKKNYNIWDTANTNLYIKNRQTIPRRSVAEFEREITELEKQRALEIKHALDDEVRNTKYYYDLESRDNEDAISEFKHCWNKIDNE